MKLFNVGDQPQVFQILPNIFANSLIITFCHTMGKYMRKLDLDIKRIGLTVLGVVRSPLREEARMVKMGPPLHFFRFGPRGAQKN